MYGMTPMGVFFTAIFPPEINEQALAVFFVKISSVFLFPVKKEKPPGSPWLLFCILLRYNMLIITYRK